MGVYIHYPGLVVSAGIYWEEGGALETAEQN